MNNVRAALLLAVAIYTHPAAAQRWVGAVKIGGISSVYAGDLATGPIDWKRQTGGFGAIAIAMNLGTALRPAVELQFVQMGASTAVRLQDVPYALESNLTYLTIPLMAEYAFPTRNELHPRVFGGPFVSVEVTSNLTLTPREEELVGIRQEHRFETIDYGFTVGAGLNFGLDSQDVGVELRYMSGSRDVSGSDPILGDASISNRGIVVLVGLHF